MARRCFVALAFVLSLVLCFADTVPSINVTKTDGTVAQYAISKVDSVSFAADNVYVHLSDGTTASVAVEDIVDMTFGEMEVDDSQDVVEGTEVTITWNGSTATVVNPFTSQGVSIAVDGADVVITSTATDEIEYVLSGNSSDGSLKIYSDKKYQFTMKGLELTNPDGPAINSQSKKKMELKAQKGYVNVLTDGSTYADAVNDEDQKGCVFSEGQIIVKGAGQLTVNGNYKHGICSDDYVTVENSVLTVNSAGDAIHANDSVKILGGTVELYPKSDGIDCEGMIVLDQDDCTLNIKVTGDDSDGVKSDSLVSVLSGTTTITATGAGAKGIKSDGMIVIGNKADGSGPTLSISTSGSRYSDSSSSGNSGNTGGWGGWGGGRPGGGGNWGGGGSSSSGSSSKGIKAEGAVYIYGGNLYVTTSKDGAEGLESKTAVYIEGGENYLSCYDDCINSSGNIYFNGGTTVCYSNGNDAVDSNAGRAGAITIGNGNVFAVSTKGSPEEGFDCDNNSYIRITGSGVAISAGGRQGGGSSSSTISGASQGYKFVTSSVSYTSGNYYTLADASGNNLATFSFPASCSSQLSLFTSPGMVKGSTYTVKSSKTQPTDATTVVGGQTGQAGLYIGSSATGTTSVTSFTSN